MTESVPAYDIAIVGGGPVGLFLGLCLQRAGRSFTILEKRQETVSHSRSLGVHPGSLERFGHLDMAEPFIRNGVQIRQGVAYSDRGKIGTISFDRHLSSPYPFILSIPQYKTEALLENHLLKRAPESLVRGAEVVDLEETESGVILTFNRNGETRRIRARLVAGCDGKESKVRDAAGIAFTGKSYEDTYVMGDFSDNTVFESDAAIFLSGGGLVESFPLPGNKRRWVVKTDTYLSNPSRRDVVIRVAERIGHDLGEEEHFMISSFGVQKLMAASMAKGRIALAGDAAHIVSPIGGQGMNLGWLDAWDLHDVCGQILDSGRDPGHTLARYSRRRKRIAKKAIRRAEFNMRLGRSTRMGLLKHLLVWLMLNTPVQRYLSRFFSMRNLE